MLQFSYMKNTERGNILVILIGIACILFLIGFFRSERSFWDTVNYKTALRLPCGLTINAPKADTKEKVAFPLSVEGYINGCGWESSGNRAGTVQVFDDNALPVTAAVPLIIPSDSSEEPFYFSAALMPTAAPRTDAGRIVVTSTTGLLYVQPVTF